MSQKNIQIPYSMILLSFIVPIFRVEKYLDTCIQSILCQGIDPSEYEIILVDDGSDDNCPAICDGYAAQYNHIHVIHQKNQGLSAARNSGIRAARGTYICFVDSDDFVEHNTYKQLLSLAMQNDLDILHFQFQINNNNRISYIYNTHTFPNEVVNGEHFLNTQMTALCYCWVYMIKRSLICETNTFFTEHITFEDVDWTPRILLQAKRVMSCDLVAYNYLIREGSITHQIQQKKVKKNIEDQLLILTYLQKNSKFAKNPTWFNSMSARVISSILTKVSQYCYTSRTEYIQQIKSIYPYKLKCHRQFHISDRIKAHIINLSPYLFCTIRHIF